MDRPHLYDVESKENAIPLQATWNELSLEQLLAVKNTLLEKQISARKYYNQTQFSQQLLMSLDFLDGIIKTKL